MNKLPLVIEGSASEAISRLQTPEDCAEFYVASLLPFAAVMEVWKHVRAVLMVEGKAKSFKTSNGKVVTLEPTRYDYDQVVVAELAPEAIVTEDVAQSEEMQQINTLAQEMYDTIISSPPGNAVLDLKWVRDYIEEFMRLSQAKTVEKVDGRKLAGILGRGDERAQTLAARQVKVPVEYKIVVKNNG